jgi:crotonobetainyl-CoA:carnitine CoA-transferase CaiB-like acyl-CoA transferase
VTGALDGARVLDLTAWQAGPTLAMILGDFGADVVKIEAPTRLDGWRGPAGLLTDQGYEKHPLWLSVNRNKRGISLDLKSGRGRELFLRLVADADVVAENFTPRVMASFDLDYETLCAVNERIIVVALSGFGATGPWRDYSAFAFPTEEISGLAFPNGARGGPPMLAGHSVTDVFAGAMGTVAVLAALHRRERTGRGNYIDLSQIETLTTFLAAELVDAQINGRDAERRGNDRDHAVPHGVFPCLPDGNWVAVVARHDDDWRRLCAVMVRDDLAADPELATLTGRLANRCAVDDAVAGWTSTRDGVEIAESLQAVGVPASAAMKPSMLLADEQLSHTEFFPVIDRAIVGAHPYPGPVVRLAKTPATFDRPAPLYGEHTDEVLRDLLGLTDDEVDELYAAGVTSQEPGLQDWR